MYSIIATRSETAYAFVFEYKPVECKQANDRVSSLEICIVFLVSVEKHEYVWTLDIVCESLDRIAPKES